MANENRCKPIRDAMRDVKDGGRMLYTQAEVWNILEIIRQQLENGNNN